MRCAEWRGIFRDREPQDPFHLARIGRADDVVKRSGAERPHVRIPISKVRKDNHRGASRGRGQNTERGAEVAVRQVVAAKYKLIGLLLDPRARGAQGIAKDGSQPEAAGNFLGFLMMLRIRSNDQHLAGVEHTQPPSDRISTTQAKQLYPLPIILSGGPLATESSRRSVGQRGKRGSTNDLPAWWREGDREKWIESAIHGM